MEERTGEAFEFAEQLTVVGSKLKPGERAPAFELDTFNTGDSTIQRVKLDDADGKVRVLNVINSLDTPVCHRETVYWEKLRSQMPDDTVVYTISMDLPFAQGRWQTAESVNHQMLSGHRSTEFGEAYGVLLKEWRLLQRAVFVIGPDGTVAHAEYVPDQMQEPNYEVAVAAAREAAGA